MGWYGQKNVNFDSDLLALLPVDENSKVVQQAIFDDSANKVFFLISENENRLDDSVSAAKMIMSELKSAEVIQFPDDTNSLDLSSFSQLYASHQYHVLSSTVKKLLKEKQYEKLGEHLSKQLFIPGNPFLADTIEVDSTLLLADLLRTKSLLFKSITRSNGFVWIDHKSKKYLLLSGEVSNQVNWSVESSEQVNTVILDVLSKVSEQYSNLNIIKSGILFHTAAASSIAKKEISRFGSLSLIALVLLVVIVFNGVKPFLPVSIVVITSLVAGYVALVSTFTSVHLLTFVFAVSLIGISADYCFHVLCSKDENDNKKETKETSLSPSTKRALITGFFTTFLGYAVLLLSPLGSIDQLVVFMMAGLAGALITSLWLLPSLSSFIKISPSKYALSFSEKLSLRFANGKISKLILVISIVGLCLLLFVGGAPKFNDDIRLLNSSPQILLNDEKDFRTVFQQQWESQFILIKGSSEQQLLEQEWELSKSLTNLITQNELVDYQAVSQWLPPVIEQKKNEQEVSNAFINNAFKSTVAMTSDDFKFMLNLNYLHPVDFFLTPIGKTIKPLWLGEVEGQFYSIVRLAGISNKVALLDTLEKFGFATFFDKPNEVSQQLSEYRKNLVIMLFVSLITMSVFLVVKYGLTKASYSTFLLSLAIGLSFLISFQIQQHLNVFNIIGSLLTLTLGIDYVVFYLEKGLCKRVVLAISLSAISTIITFGMLVFSVTPAVFSFGLTVCVGICFIYLLAPLICHLNKE
jgi:predicted exporter